MKVVATKLHEARTDATCEWYSHRYATHDGLVRIEKRTLETDSDFLDAVSERQSPDNGKTWGEWKDITASAVRTVGPHEWEEHLFASVWNPVHRHYVDMTLERVFTFGHIKAYERWWGHAEPSFSDHTRLRIRKDAKDIGFSQLAAYEEGAEAFDENDPLSPKYYGRNEAYCGMNLEIDANGDLLFPMGVPVSKCFEILNQSPEELFPSCPQIMHGLILARGIWNGERYEFEFSRPIVISDRLSSRGVDEPTLALLDSGRIVMVFRGSNAEMKNWNTRIERGAPGVKWYTYSDDGGKTFTDPFPWHFDDGTFIHSSATISYFLKNTQNGRHYWLGNITSPEVQGNYPRWPLCLVRIDDKTGKAEKESLTIIDTKREGESEHMQLSNFSFLQNRESGTLEIYVTKIGQFEGRPWQEGEAWHYTVDWK